MRWHVWRTAVKDGNGGPGMKVLHIFNSIEASGAELMWIEATKALAELGVRTTFVATKGDVGTCALKAREAGYDVVHVPHSTKRIVDFRYCVALFRYLRRERFDAVQIHPEAWRLTNSLVSRLAGVPSVVTTVLNVFDVTGLRKVQRIFRFLIIRFLGVKIVACGRSVYESECGYFYRPVLIWNWIAVERFLQLDREKARIEVCSELGVLTTSKMLICVGNCAPSKNHVFLFEVLKCLPADYILLHVGAESKDLDEHKLATMYGVSDRVKFLGRRLDLPRLYAAANVFVMPSLKEGFSLACTKAILAGLPAVVSDVSGLRDAAAMFSLCEKTDLDVKKFAACIVNSATMTKSVYEERFKQSRQAVVSILNMDVNVAEYVRLWKGAH